MTSVAMQRPPPAHLTPGFERTAVQLTGVGNNALKSKTPAVAEESAATPNKTATLCLFGCLASIGLRNKIVRQLAFFPPRLPGYLVEVESPYNSNDDDQSRSSSGSSSDDFETRDWDTRAYTDIDLVGVCRECGTPTIKSSTLNLSRNKHVTRSQHNQKRRYSHNATIISPTRSTAKDRSTVSPAIKSSPHSRRVHAATGPCLASSLSGGPLCQACAAQGCGEVQHYDSLTINYKFVLPYMSNNPVDVRDIVQRTANVKVSFHWLRTARNEKIGALLLKLKSAPFDAAPFVIFSHGNSTDIGYMFPHYYALACKSKCHVLGYDYSGYGQSTGVPSERNTFADIRAAYRFAVDILGVPWKNIIIYGQSVGSGPSCDIAADHRRYPIGGLVLHSPIASGLRILLEDLKKSPYFDCFKNADKINRAQCPIFLVHGTKDSQVNCRHSQLLYTLARLERASHKRLGPEIGNASRDSALSEGDATQSSRRRSSRASVTSEPKEPEHSCSGTVTGVRRRRYWIRCGGNRKLKTRKSRDTEGPLSDHCASCDEMKFESNVVRTASGQSGFSSGTIMTLGQSSVFSGSNGIRQLAADFPLLERSSLLAEAPCTNGLGNNPVPRFLSSPGLVEDPQVDSYLGRHGGSRKHRSASISLAEFRGSGGLCVPRYSDRERRGSTGKALGPSEIHQDGNVILWLVTNADHNNIEEKRPHEFYDKMRVFLGDCVSYNGNH